jgi:hypothetical protein
MLSWIIQITLISVVIVFLIHHLIDFLRETLTVPKIKDLVNVPYERYQKMHYIIEKGQKMEDRNNEINNDMKNELKQFMKMQLDNQSQS